MIWSYRLLALGIFTMLVISCGQKTATPANPENRGLDDLRILKDCRDL